MPNNYLNKNKDLFDQDRILELAVRAVVDPDFGWITASIILYGCNEKEVFSLIPKVNGKASVINSNNLVSKQEKREVLAIPIDFVRKLNLIDQISKPISIDSYKNYDTPELKIIIRNWNEWFYDFSNNMNFDDIRHSWALRSINNGIPINLAADSFGISNKEFYIKYAKNNKISF